MADGRRREDWQHTSYLAAWIANTSRNPKKKPSPFTPDELNPMLRRNERAGTVVVDEDNIADMRAMFDQMGKEPV